MMGLFTWGLAGAFLATQMPLVVLACTLNKNARWEPIGQLPAPVESHAMVVSSDRIYVLGGWNEEDGPRAQVAFTALKETGSLGSWQFTTASLPLSLQHHAVVVHKGALYVLGGDTGFGENGRVSDRIFRGVPNTRGDILRWEEIGKLPDRRTIHGVATAGDRIYVIGGTQDFRSDSKVVDTIFTSTFTPSGKLAPWQKLTPFPEPIGWLTATIVGKHLFTISGKIDFAGDRLTEKIWRSVISPSGKLSTFQTIGTTEPRERHAAVTLGNTLVLIAGGGAKTVLNTVEVTKVTPQGNLSPWRSLPSLPESRYAHAAFGYGGQVYVSGGFIRYGNNATSSLIWRLPICSKN